MKPHTGFLSVGRLYISIDIVSLTGNNVDRPCQRQYYVNDEPYSTYRLDTITYFGYPT
jgi:hypothetical protein